MRRLYEVCRIPECGVKLDYTSIVSPICKVDQMITGVCRECHSEVEGEEEVFSPERHQAAIRKIFAEFSSSILFPRGKVEVVMLNNYLSHAKVSLPTTEEEENSEAFNREYKKALENLRLLGDDLNFSVETLTESLAFVRRRENAKS